MRAILASAIYHKSLRLDATQLKKKAAVTLINTDLKGVDQLVELAYESIVYVVEIGLGITMLAKFVGAATIFALIPTVGMFPPSDDHFRFFVFSWSNSCNGSRFVCLQENAGYSPQMERAYSDARGDYVKYACTIQGYQDDGTGACICNRLAEAI